MTAPGPQLHRHRHTLLALAAAAVCLAVVLAVWLAAVRPQAGKSLSAYISDDYSQSTLLEAGDSVAQSFAFDEGPLALGFVFFIPGEQPQGTLELHLLDAASGEVLAASEGDMAYILSGQYTVLGLDRTLPDAAGRTYTVTLTPHYTGDGRLAVGHSQGVALWQQPMTCNGHDADATLALLVSYHRIGGFVSRFFLLIGLAVCVAVFFGVRAALAGGALHRTVFALVLAFGLLYCAVLPPYAAPDEKYHINQAFTLACRWANALSDEEWRMGEVPLEISYRREHDADPVLQDENTTVFTWQALANGLFTASPDRFDSHVELAELQTDRNPLLYLVSAAAVFLGFVLRLGFVPVLLLGRLANLLLFAALAALAVYRAPFGKRVFAAAALLPMTLHLAASFSRDAPLMGLCFLFTALYLDAAFGRESGPLPWRRLAALAAVGVLLAPAKVVYLPLAALALLLPDGRLGARPWLKRTLYLAACLLLTLGTNNALLRDRLTAPAAAEAVTVSGDPAPDETSAPRHNAPGHAALEEQLRTDSVEDFVRRLYYWAEGQTDPAQSEVEYWSAALREGLTSPVLLAQSFFFSPDAALSGAALLSAESEVFLLRDAPAEDPDHFDALLAQYSDVYLFSVIYGSEEAADHLAACGLTPGQDDLDRYPLDRAALVAEVEAARATRASQSVAAAEDLACYTPGYVLRHPLATLALLLRSLLENGDHYLRGVVGGSLSYYTVDVAWSWVLALYLLLAFALLPTAAELDEGLLPAGCDRAWCLAAALACAALTVAGCLLWTPRTYTTLYGWQGRYLLPVLPLALAVCRPQAICLRDTARARAQLLTGLCLVNGGVLLNAMLVILAR